MKKYSVVILDKVVEGVDVEYLAIKNVETKEILSTFDGQTGYGEAIKECDKLNGITTETKEVDVLGMIGEKVKPVHNLKLNLKSVKEGISFNHVYGMDKMSITESIKEFSEIEGTQALGRIFKEGMAIVQGLKREHKDALKGYSKIKANNFLQNEITKKQKSDVDQSNERFLSYVFASEVVDNTYKIVKSDSINSKLKLTVLKGVSLELKPVKREIEGIECNCIDIYYDDFAISPTSNNMDIKLRKNLLKTLVLNCPELRAITEKSDSIVFVKDTYQINENDFNNIDGELREGLISLIDNIKEYRRESNKDLTEVSDEFIASMKSSTEKLTKDLNKLITSNMSYYVKKEVK